MSPSPAPPLANNMFPQGRDPTKSYCDWSHALFGRRRYPLANVTTSPRRFSTLYLLLSRSSFLNWLRYVVFRRPDLVYDPTFPPVLQQMKHTLIPPPAPSRDASGPTGFSRSSSKSPVGLFTSSPRVPWMTSLFATVFDFSPGQSFLIVCPLLASQALTYAFLLVNFPQILPS